MELTLARSARTQPDHRARWRRQRLPSNDGPDVRPRLRVVGDPWKSPAQLDSSRQLALLIEDCADCIGIGLGDDEHPKSMVARRTAGKRGVRLVSLKSVIKNKTLMCEGRYPNGPRHALSPDPSSD
jgi:hypothetical protein